MATFLAWTFGAMLQPITAKVLATTVTVLLGLSRETVQNYGDPPAPGSLADSILDGCFWAFGSFVGAMA